MPPKKQPQGSSSKIKEDKTFGMKNKKGAKGQKAVQLIQQQSAMAGKSPAAIAKEKERELREKEKAEAAKRAKEDAALLAQPVQKIAPGVDPMTVYCVYHKAGYCQKGNKCKFSHDPNVGRKVEKKDVYADSREEKLTDTMDKWDEEKLRKVVSAKGNPRTTTEIVCKYFIEAIETERFGWFWTCPNDVSEKNGCMYRHALPPGFVLKSQKKAIEQAARADVISLEEFLEVEVRISHSVPYPTQIRQEFNPGDARNIRNVETDTTDKKVAEAEALKAAKDAKHAAGKNVGMSGRDLFSYNPEWFEEQDDEDEDDRGDREDWDWAAYRKQQIEENERAEAEKIAAFNEGFKNTSEGSEGAGGSTADGHDTDTGDGGPAGSSN
ncbi:hypothetical protein BS47DRAFT_1399479 [Hydnum rufescens UP504]|uniref:C3H1-type domain-containing protein n=1 Tax=Hydnum rufescens UP504 TaxID=1448309 RepID=A0A9P6DPN0_9AGAM|nr:hypothetical protein BS47DRAFT_1399479 [Hydnum rufescens UP504]